MTSTAPTARPSEAPDATNPGAGPKLLGPDLVRNRWSGNHSISGVGDRTEHAGTGMAPGAAASSHVEDDGPASPPVTAASSSTRVASPALGGSQIQGALAATSSPPARFPTADTASALSQKRARALQGDSGYGTTFNAAVSSDLGTTPSFLLSAAAEEGDPRSDKKVQRRVDVSSSVNLMTSMTDEGDPLTKENSTCDTSMTPNVQGALALASGASARRYFGGAGDASSASVSPLHASAAMESLVRGRQPRAPAQHLPGHQMHLDAYDAAASTSADLVAQKRLLQRQRVEAQQLAQQRLLSLQESTEDVMGRLRSLADQWQQSLAAMAQAHLSALSAAEHQLDLLIQTDADARATRQCMSRISDLLAPGGGR